MKPTTTAILLTISLMGASAPALAMANTAGAANIAVAAVKIDEATVNAPYNAFLAKYVTTANGINLIRYSAVTKEDRAALKGYIAALEKLAPSKMDKNSQLAFWFNLYNAKTIDIILDNYPVKSIRDIGGNLVAPGPWKMPVLTVEGKSLSLDNIEHDTVRKMFKEPRVHYAFNCASIGCPNLNKMAWSSANLDAQLDAAARDFVAHPRGVVIEANGKIKASNIYKWFKVDFGGNDAGVLAHLRKYATGEKLEKLKAATKIDSYDYNWSLNKA